MGEQERTWNFALDSSQNCCVNNENYNAWFKSQTEVLPRNFFVGALALQSTIAYDILIWKVVITMQKKEMRHGHLLLYSSSVINRMTFRAFPKSEKLKKKKKNRTIPGFPGPPVEHQNL